MDPRRLSGSDWVDLSNLSRPRLNTSHSEALQSPVTRIHFFEIVRGLIPFPAETHGFLYFVPAPHETAQLASEIRFRITRNNDPSSFAAGNDLLNTDFTPWHIPLVTLARRKQYLHLKQLLLQDGLTTSSLLSRCAALGHGLDPQEHIIHSLGQLFSVDCTLRTQGFHFASVDSMHNLRVCLFGDRRRVNDGGQCRVPYAGKFLACDDWQN